MCRVKTRKFVFAIVAVLCVTAVVVAATMLGVDYLVTNSRALAGGMLLECYPNMTLYAAHTQTNTHIPSYIHNQTFSSLIAFIQIRQQFVVRTVRLWELRWDE